MSGFVQFDYNFHSFRNVLIPLSAWKTLKRTKRKMFMKLRELYENNPSRYFVFGNDSFGPTTPLVPLPRLDGFVHLNLDVISVEFIAKTQ